MTKQMNGKQTNIRDYWILPAMLERNIVIDFYYLAGCLNDLGPELQIPGKWV